MLDPALIPFFLLLLLYLITFSPHLGRTPEVWTSVILKILPVWYLAIYVVFKNYGRKANSKKANSRQNSQTKIEGLPKTKNPRLRISENIVHDVDEKDIVSSNGARNHLDSDQATKQDSLSLPDDELPFKKRFVIGLLISSVGDACLVYISLFKVGILAFGAAQTMYLMALKHRYRKSRLAWVAVPLCITLNAILAPGIDEIILNILVLGYSIFIHSMLFYAIAGFESFPSKKSFSTMIGASLFIASDFLIALNKWVIITPYPQASILSTYYTAQLLLTIGIC